MALLRLLTEFPFNILNLTAMKTLLMKFILGFCIMVYTTALFAQKSIQEFVDKSGKDKVKKSVVIGQRPVTAAGFADGHGRNPLFVRAEQIPDTVALITLFIYDLGTTTVSRGGNVVTTTYTWVSPAGGNALANGIHQQSIDKLKSAFRSKGIVLLTPDEYLNTDEKRNYYHKTFTPKISKLGKFLGNLETKHVDISVAADNYRAFDIAAAYDHLRSESYGSDLAKKLGVGGVLSIAIELQSDDRNVNMHGVKMALHGPNPVPKEDKNYVAQNLGNGYYYGNIYADAVFFLPKPISVGGFDKKKIEGERKRVTVMEGMNFDGVGTIMECMVEEMHRAMLESIEKAAAKYK
jgi:hypothetical protein